VPVVARELTSVEVTAISAPGTHAVGGVTGLCLQVTAVGARSWLLRITVDQRRREFGLGAFPTVTVPAARNAARALREKIGHGADPALQHRAARAARQVHKSKAVTFKACAEAFLAAELASGRDARYVGVVLRDLERLAFPQLGRSVIGSVTTESVLGVLGPVWTAKPAVATKLRGTIERVLDYAEAHGFRDGINPARWKGHLDRLLASPASVRQHERHASLPADQIPEFFAELGRMPGVASLALQFLILTAARPQDVREMRWSELDIDGASWNLSVERSTTATSCRVPLSKPALRLLATMVPAGPQSPVFTAPRTGHALSDMTLTAVLRRMNDRRRARDVQAWTDSMQGSREIVPAGFRTTFRSWAALTQEHIEGARYLLAAPSETSAQGQARASGFEHAKRALEAWARHCRHATKT
jgi:integrase